MNRRLTTLVVGAVPIAVLAGLLTAQTVPGTNIALTVPFVAQGPGPTIDTLGQFDGQDVITIDGAPVDGTSGQLNMTTVSVWSNLTLIEAVRQWLDPARVVVPAEQVFPPNATAEEVEQQNAEAFASSEFNATAAALHQLNLPMEVEIVSLAEGSPAAGVLGDGDVLISVGGTPVGTPQEVVDAVGERAPGDEVEVVYRRDGQQQSSPVTLGAYPGDDSRAFLGVTLGAAPGNGVTITYNLQDIGGPSAGLIFSLAVVDMLSPGELTGGRFVAGTGTIDPDGEVGPIGGITHKIRAAADAGAEVFLVPADNCSEALTAPAGDMQLVKVDTLGGAVDSLSAIQEGGSAPACG